MARKTCICFISLIILAEVSALSQDTVTVPLHIRTGFDAAAPLMKLFNNDLTTYGIVASVDLNQAFTVVTGLRYTSFHTSGLFYDFNSNGLSITAGSDYNFISARLSKGKHFAGIGVRYGMSFYSEEAPMIRYINEWGTATASLGQSRHTGHFLEVTPGVRTELFPGVTIGWNLYMRLLLSAGAGSDIKPVWMPGYGAATSGMTTGAEYYISVSIPFKKIKVAIKPKVIQPDDEDGTGIQIPGPDR